MLTFEVPLEEDTTTEAKDTQLESLFEQLKSAIAERADIYELYSMDVYRERNCGEAYGMSYSLCLGEKHRAQRAVERARKAIVDYVFDTESSDYDASLSILQEVGVACLLPKEKEHLERIGISEGSRILLGQTTLDIVNAPRLALWRSNVLTVTPMVVYETKDTQHRKMPVQVRCDRVTERGAFMRPDLAVVHAEIVTKGELSES